MKKAFFTCKPANLEEVKEAYERAEANGTMDILQQTYYIASRKTLNTAEWDSLTSAFLEDRDWLTGFSEKNYGMKGTATPCILVRCPEKKKALLIDTQGYAYARYVAIIND